VWVVACRVVGIGATLASNILAARLLGPAQFGAYLVVTTVLALGGLVGMVGLNEAALRFISENLALERFTLARAYLRRALLITAVASAVSAFAIAVGFEIFILATGRHQQPLLLVVIALGVALLAWQQVGAELARAYGDLRLASLFSGGQTGGPLSNLLFLAGLGMAVLAAGSIDATLAASVVVGSLCLTCPLVYLGLWNTSQKQVMADARPRLSSEQSRELLAVGGVLLINQLLAFVTQQLDLWLAGGLLSQESLGLYGAAKRGLLMAAMPVQMAMLTIVSTIPRLHAQARTAELERVMRRAATAAAIPALLALAALTIFPRQILSAVFGGSYGGAEVTLIVLALGHYVLVLSGNPQHVLTMTGRHRAVLGVNFISAIVLIVVGVAGARAFGAPGLAAGSAASLAVQNGLLWWLARRELGIWTHVGFLGRGIAGHSPDFLEQTDLCPAEAALASAGISPSSGVCRP
jgi:O-antigen/teichoic acid export membrane protein